MIMMGREGGGRRDVGGGRMGELHLEIYAQVIQRHDNDGAGGMWEGGMWEGAEWESCIWKSMHR